MKFIPVDKIKVGSIYLYISIDKRGTRTEEIEIDALIRVTSIYQYSPKSDRVEFTVLKSFCGYLRSGEEEIFSCKKDYDQPEVSWALRRVV